MPQTLEEQLAVQYALNQGLFDDLGECTARLAAATTANVATAYAAAMADAIRVVRDTYDTTPGDAHAVYQATVDNLCREMVAGAARAAAAAGTGPEDWSVPAQVTA